MDDLTQLGTVGLDNEVDRQSVGGRRLGRPDDGHQCSSSSNQACGPLPDVAADDIEHQIDFADVFQGVVFEVDELLRAEVGTSRENNRLDSFRTNKARFCSAKLSNRFPDSFPATLDPLAIGTLP
jgi:hypothetical protein